MKALCKRGRALLLAENHRLSLDAPVTRYLPDFKMADPGAYSVCCSDGLTLAELVMEAVSGQDFMDYVEANILRPAGLDAAFAPGGGRDCQKTEKSGQREGR